MHLILCMYVGWRGNCLYCRLLITLNSKVVLLPDVITVAYLESVGLPLDGYIFATSECLGIGVHPLNLALKLAIENVMHVMCRNI